MPDQLFLDSLEQATDAYFDELILSVGGWRPIEPLTMRFQFQEKPEKHC